MENLKFKKSWNESGLVISFEVDGALVLENSQQLKKELVEVLEVLDRQVKITIINMEDIDLSCIQLILAFIKRMDEINVTYQFNWDINKDQKLLLNHVGFYNELFMNNLYA